MILALSPEKGDGAFSISPVNNYYKIPVAIYNKNKGKEAVNGRLFC